MERIDPRFFNKSAGDRWPDVVARYNHDDNFVLGTTNAGMIAAGPRQRGPGVRRDLPVSTCGCARTGVPR